MGCISCNAPVELGSSRSELQSQLTQLRAYNDATNNYYGYAFTGTYDFHRVYIDTDESAATGFAHCGLGANYLVENTHVYQYTGDGTSWSWSSLGTVTANVTTSPATWTVPRATLGETAFPNAANVCFETETSANVLDTSALYHHAYTDETVPIHALVAYNDDTNIVYQATYDTSYTYKRVYIDANEGATSGFLVSGVGAEYMIENGHLYQYTGTGTNWSWSLLGDSNMTPATQGATGVTTWTIARSTINETATPERADIVFNGQPSGGSNVYAAKYDHDYSGGVSTPGTTVDTSYTLDSTPTLRNPERGMYSGSDSSTTLVPDWLWLESVCDQTLTWGPLGVNDSTTSQVLKLYAQGLESYRQAGVKVIFRPRYDTSDGSGNGPSHCVINGAHVFHADSITRQKNHIDQIAKMLHEYRDVVAYIQAGYLGRWGEWNWASYSAANAPFLSSITDRATIIDYVLSAYANQNVLQHVELRRPVFAKEVLDRNSSARVGVHDDCFNTDLYDQGTYYNFDSSNPSNFSSQDAARTWNANTLTPSASFGGETCDISSSDRWKTCSNMTGATADPVIMHMNYLNADHAANAVATWTSGGCYSEIRSKLGYRFEVTRVEYTPTVSAGQSFTVLVDIHNTGWARLHKPRTAKLVLRNGAATYVYDAGSGATASWAPNTTTRLSVSAVAPPAGTYSIRLWIPDPDNTSSIDYAVKLASLRGGTNVFDSANGENNLGVSMTVN